VVLAHEGDTGAREYCGHVGLGLQFDAVARVFARAGIRIGAVALRDGLSKMRTNCQRTLPTAMSLGGLTAIYNRLRCLRRFAHRGGVPLPNKARSTIVP